MRSMVSAGRSANVKLRDLLGVLVPFDLDARGVKGEVRVDNNSTSLVVLLPFVSSELDPFAARNYN